MRPQEIIFGLAGQTFYYDVPEGRPSSPGLTVYMATSDDDTTSEAATSGSPTVDSVSTTLAQAAAATAQTLELADGTGVSRGRRYLLTDTDGDQELVEVIARNGTTVSLRQPLKNDYAIASSLVGCRITCSVSDSWAATKSKITDILGSTWKTSREARPWVPGTAGYRLRWTYTVGGAAQLGVSYADLVRYQAKNLVNPLDVDGRFPGWIDRLPPDYQRDQGASLIAEAFHAMRMDMIGDDQLARRVRDTQVLSELVVYRANVVAQEASIFAGGGSADALKLAQDGYERRYRQLIREPKVPVDQTGGGSAGEPRRAPAFRR
jgi:hypothetical protein